jgi:hypothetical protein
MGEIGGVARCRNCPIERKDLGHWLLKVGEKVVNFEMAFRESWQDRSWCLVVN